MRLRRLEMQGFKSFPDKTVLNFGNGFTAVVGPNGSGKSNISDAVRWVLGEQSSKTLRGSKMEDVIFDGTEKRKSQGYARVSLVFDNSDRTLPFEVDEVTVTRKYYRSGDSEYIINQEQVRLKDLQQLFMDTGLGKDGYSLVGQGKIAEIVSAKSSERREIFEEAAGIAKFRYRKNEAERKLTQAEDNLLRLRDILNELDGRLEPLRIQSEKAARFLELSDRKKSLEITIWLARLDRAGETLRTQEKEYAEVCRDYRELADGIAETEQKLERGYQLSQQLRDEIEQMRQEHTDLETARASRTADAAVRENDIRHHEEAIERLNGLLSDSQAAGMLLQQEEAALDEKQAELSAACAALEEQISAAEEGMLRLHTQSEKESERVRSLSEELNQTMLAASSLQAEQLAAEQAGQEAEAQRVRWEATLRDTESQLSQIEAELQDTDALLGELTAKKQGLQNSGQGYELKLTAREQAAEKLREQAEHIAWQEKEKRQRITLLTDLENRMEGFAQSVKSVLQAAKTGELRGIHGTVSQLIRAEDDYALAVETALGGALQHIVVENEAAAKSAIRLLKEEKKGRATFLPLTTMRSRGKAKNYSSRSGFVAMADTLVQTDDVYRPLMSSLLGHILVAEDLNAATEIARAEKYQVKIVTLDGQVIHAGGSFTGGSPGRQTGVLSRKNEIEALEREAARLAEENAAAEHKAKTAAEEVLRLRAEWDALQAEERTVQEDIIRAEGEQKRLCEQRELLSAQREQCRENRKREAERVSAAEQTVQEIEQARTASEQKRLELEESLRTLDQSQQELEKQRGEAADLLSSLRVQQVEQAKDGERLAAEREALTARLSDAASRRESWETEREAICTLIRSIRTELDSFAKEEQRDKEQAQLLLDRMEEHTKRLGALEQETVSLREQDKAASSKREELSREMVRLEEQKARQQQIYDELIGRLWEEYQLTRSEADALRIETEQPLKLQSELSAVRASIKALGNVNVAAIEEYREVSERYAFLSAQVADVEHSRNELNRLIHDLTKNMCDLFTDSFVRINRNFGEIFADLFGGGKASLELTDPENVLESGIEIHVQPPGKIIRHLSSLSGGEQSFVAIAIYFAILRVRPAPFCVLDEIEAALDDVNVVKFAGYLRQMCKDTQFIVITHRRGTMEEADVLYGVTMQEEGVSRLLTLPIREMASRVLQQA